MPERGPGVRPFSWSELDADRESAPSAAGARPFRWTDLGEGAEDEDRSPAAQTPHDLARAALELAHAEGAEIVAAARREAEELRERARVEGLAAGKGEAQEVLVAHVGRLEALVVALSSHKAALWEEARGQAVELCLAIVNRLLGPLAEGDAQAVVRVVERALQLLTERETLTIRVHPDDLKSVVDAKPAILAVFDGIQKLTVLEDPSVRRGGALVRTPTTEIDARLETQLGELVRAVRGTG